MQYELDINGDRVISDPDDATIERELSALGDEEFAILRKDDLTFIQTFVDPEDGLVLEYQEGSLQAHFGTIDPPDTMQEVIDAFSSYSNGTDVWKHQFRWVPMELTQSSFTVVVSVAPEAIGEIEHPFEGEGRLELPDIGLDHLMTLYGVLTDTSAESLEPEFSTLAEITPEGLDGVLLIEVPRSFVKLLSQPAPDAIGTLAAQWHASDHFPSGEYDKHAAAIVVTDLSEMATDALESGKTMIVCDLQ